MGGRERERGAGGGVAWMGGRGLNLGCCGRGGGANQKGVATFVWGRGLK